MLYQACAVPYRLRDDSIEFCLTTSTRTDEWRFPKGTIKREQTEDETALTKAQKEVGLHGRIVGNLGSYSYRKWEMTMEVVALLMQVEQCDDDWEQSSKRKRRWVDIKEAVSLVRRQELKVLLESAYSQIQGRTLN